MVRRAKSSELVTKTQPGSYSSSLSPALFQSTVQGVSSLPGVSDVAFSVTFPASLSSDGDTLTQIETVTLTYIQTVTLGDGEVISEPEGGTSQATLTLTRIDPSSESVVV